MDVVAVVAIVLFCLFPFYWLLNTSLKTGRDLSTSALVPPNPTLENYKSIFQDSNFTNALKNSAIVALVTTALALVVGSFCAYALARLRIRFKFGILAIILTITTFPQITIAAPIFKLWRDIGLYNTIPGLVIPYLTFALPLAIYILTSFFREIPGISRRRRSWTERRTSRRSTRSWCRSRPRAWPLQAS